TMKDYDSDRLRNVALMGHGSCGKTTLAEALLFASGALSRMGRVEDHNTVSDFDEQEHSHQYSISSSMIPIEWAGHRINLIDTPGYADFEGEVVSAAAAADAALIAVDAASGVEAGTELAWQLADEAGGLPRMLLVTRLDREFSDFRRVFDQLRDRFGTRLVPLALPIGDAQELAGVVDVLSGTARRGAEPCEVPPEMADAIAEARE